MGYELSIIGLLVSLVYISITRYYPGGIIVPSYLVLFIGQPLRILGTLIAALLAMAAYRLASRYLILFGRRRFVFLLLLGGFFAYLLSFFLPLLFPATIELRVIGWVIPGLVAGHFDRQGIIPTASSLVIVVTVIFFIGKLYFMVF